MLFFSLFLSISVSTFASVSAVVVTGGIGGSPTAAEAVTDLTLIGPTIRLSTDASGGTSASGRGEIALGTGGSVGSAVARLLGLLAVTFVVAPPLIAADVIAALLTCRARRTCRNDSEDSGVMRTVDLSLNMEPLEPIVLSVDHGSDLLVERAIGCGTWADTRVGDRDRGSSDLALYVEAPVDTADFHDELTVDVEIGIIIALEAERERCELLRSSSQISLLSLLSPSLLSTLVLPHSLSLSLLFLTGTRARCLRRT